MSHSASASGRRGFALPAAIFALVLLSALVAGVLFVSTEELRSGRTDTADQRALALAESALDSAIMAWDSRRNTGDTVGVRFGAAVRSAPNVAVTVDGVRTGRRAVLVSATALAGGDGRTIPVRRTVAMALRLVGATVATRAALITPGLVVVDGGRIDGRDSVSVPDATRVCTPPAPGVGIATPDSTRITCVGCGTGYDPAVVGTPAVDASSTVDATVADLGDETRAALIARADIDLPAGTYVPTASVVGGACDVTDRMSWGDPSGASACADWYPIIHVRGDVTIAAGAAGQGMLVADGSVRVEANARFSGVVVATGTVMVDGSGAELDGIVFALGFDASAPSRVVNGGTIRYASCAARRAMLGSARLVRTTGRSWVELR